MSSQEPRTSSGHEEITSSTQEAQSEAVLHGLHQKIADLIKENSRLVEAVAARDAFLAVAAHELRNPITPIVGRLEILRRTLNTASKEKIEWSLDQIAWLMSRFVKRATTLLDISRLTSGKELILLREPVDVCELIKLIAEGLRPVAEHARCELQIDLSEDVILVEGDSLAIEQVVENLVSNAMKYAGGKPIVISVQKDNFSGVACIAVADNGPGISEQDTARIFERFERAVNPGEHSGGYGVGLWIVRQLCEAMQGTIEIKSRRDVGSTFTISLPLLKQDEK